MKNRYLLKYTTQRLRACVITGLIAVFFTLSAAAESTKPSGISETHVEEIVQELSTKGLISQEEAEELMREHNTVSRPEVRAGNEEKAVSYESTKATFSDGLDYELLVISIIVLVAFGLPAIAIICITYWTFRRRKLMHETINALIAKDRDIPQSMLAYIDKTYMGKAQHLEAGIFMTAIGLALLISLWVFISAGIGMLVGLPPAAIGVSNLILWRAEKRHQDHVNPDARS